MVLGSTDEGLVVALPPERSLEEFHFEQARHGHTLKLLPDPSLLDPIQGDDASRASVSMRATAWGFTAPDLTAEELAELEQITGAVLQDRAERYGGRRPLSETGAEVITSRHIFHPGNERATMFVADEFQALGEKLTVRLHRFTHAGRHLHNVEVELQGLVPELVLLTAHLDSTAAFSAPYDADTVTLWCSNGSQSCSLQRVFACRRPENPAQ